MENNLNPCQHLTADAIGKPGQRVFYLQGWTTTHTITLIIEKVQLQTLAIGIFSFLDELQTRHPELEIPGGKYSESTMRIIPPVDPLFRVGEIGLAYDRENEQACLIAREIAMEANALAEETDQEVETNVIRFWCSREQLKSLANWSLELVQRGRPICPLCNEPIEPSGHFCPKKNGHEKH